MANYLSDRTGANIDEVLDDADTGNIGKAELASFSGDLNSVLNAGFLRTTTSTTNVPLAQDGAAIIMVRGSGVASQIWSSNGGDAIYFRRTTSGGNWQPWQEIYHTGNTGSSQFNGPLTPGLNFVDLSAGGAAIVAIGRSGTVGEVAQFFNDNGKVGTIAVSGTATAYNTSSDPRLKDFAEAPTDLSINTEFDKLFSCFRTFNWKNDPEGDLVWGFDAHACIDTGTDIGSEGEGPRGLSLGAVYETIPAVTESRVVMDAEGNPTSDIETVVITAAIEKKVSPAGVDQSKAVPVLLAKVEQLERRLTLAGL